MNGRSQRLLNMAASNQLMPLYTEARASRSSHSHMSSKHGNTEEALERIGGLNLELDLLHAFSPAADKLGKSLGEFETYILNNIEFIPNFGERYRHGETISTAFCRIDD